MQIVLADLLNKPIETPIIFNPEMHLDSEQLIGRGGRIFRIFTAKIAI